MVTSGLPPQRANNAELWCFLDASLNKSAEDNSRMASDFRSHDTHVASLLYRTGQPVSLRF